GLRTRMPVRGRDGLVEVRSAGAKGRVSACGPDRADPAEYDLVALAMQEPQYRLSGVRELLERVAQSRTPAMSIMNMPPLPYLARLPGVNVATLRDCYADPAAWDGFDPALVTLASPDPQAFRPADAPANLLQVSLPTNFKVAAFADPRHTAMLRRIEADIQAVRFDPGGGPVELPVKLRVHDSVFVPLAKWAMLLTGNYRCVTPEGPRSIRDAVHSDPDASRAVYDWVRQVCMALGAAEADLVPFEKYAAAAEGLVKPSSAVRALHGGAPFIERVDRLVQRLAAGRDMRNETVDRTVALVDAQLERNGQEAAV
ncbi:MAG TPA: hypothetical protein VFJ13_11435, partial [Paracoccaceae bacterium]|nr:hypothetical protein [Paracoccaceae bacterium]